jgi:hypothetical protein
MKTRIVELNGIKFLVVFSYEKPEPETGYKGGYEIYEVTPLEIESDIIDALEELR